jgi:hemoglobin/transferrin/lactoferrin receptor protein
MSSTFPASSVRTFPINVVILFTILMGIPFTMVLGIQLTISDKLRVQLYAAYQGKRKHEDMAEEEKGKDEICAADADGNTHAPGWYTLNFNAMYRLTDHLSTSAGIENLTDQRYRLCSSGISGPGRNLFLSLWANF